MAPVNVGIIGFGTVGTGTYELLVKNRGLIADRVGAEVIVKTIADLDLDSDRGVTVEPGVLTREAMEVIDDPEIQVVVELIGGIDKAKDYILESMKRGKDVVTANKALLAECGPEIFAAAGRHGVNLAFEASVGGGIPLIGALKSGLSANHIESMIGILNGTSNYILTRMAEERISYSEAVREAVLSGFAEDPPTLDVDGTDAAHKLAVIISLVFGIPISFREVYREGISELSLKDIHFAHEFGYRVKLLAVSRIHGDQVEIRVHPAMIPKDHILANVNHVYNALYIEGDFVGPNLYYGLGAGRRPTASAVVSDIICLARQIRLGVKGLIPALGYVRTPSRNLSIQSMDELSTDYYFRFSAVDSPGVLSKISGILGDHNISISSVIQMGREVNGPVPIVMLTHEALERDVLKAVSLIDNLDILTDKTIMIRVERGYPHGGAPAPG